ncbi:MAG: hypothetical protein JWR15_2967 [Prosthecobacter sp.]|nr:hypothetical protein [Prosthecobacter sp.]
MEPIAYYIIYQAQQAGPFTQEQLQEMIAMGKITPEQSSWYAGMTEWRPLSEFFPPMVPKSVPQPPQTHSAPAPVRPAPPKSSKTWVWVTLTVLAVLGGLGALIGYGAYVFLKKGTAEMAYLPLQEERAGHETHWQKSSLKSAGPVEQPDGKNFLAIRYHSPAGDLSAYLTPDPKDGKKHPAIVWAHSFSGGIGSSFWQPTEDGYNLTARAFREKGIVMMCPSWRGENENPGRIELLYGEVDDFLAAIEHLKKLPYVDPERIYIGGHNIGGTLTLLTASATDQFCAAFSVGGMLTLKQSKDEQLPFRADSERDFQLRSPLRYAGFIRRPVFYFEADVHFDKSSTQQMQRRASPHFQAFHLEGTHFDILHTVTQLIAEKIAADSELHFTDEELMKSYRLADLYDQQMLLTGTGDEDHGLSAVLTKSGTGPGNLIPLTLGDVKILQNALMVFNEKKDCSPETMATVVKLANLRGRITGGPVFGAFDMALSHGLSEWALMRLRLPGELTGAEEKGIFDIVRTVAFTHDSIAADLVATALQRGIMPDSKIEWLNLLLNAYNFQSSQTGRFLSAFASDPPSGRAGELLLTYLNSMSVQGWDGSNPYNSKKGLAILEAWVASKDPLEYHRASLAAYAAAFLDAEFRDVILDFAFKHPSKHVHLQAAWSDAKSGGSRGIPMLKQACQDVELSAGAQNCLKSLLREDEIPPAASDSGIFAKSFISQMLMAPSQLGTNPLSIDIYDHKNIFWPPMKEKCDIWLLKFTFQPKDGGTVKTGYGFHSKYTSWCSIKGLMTPKMPEDLYVYTCAMDFLQLAKSRGKSLTREKAEAEALMALRANNPGVFDAVKLSSKP